MTRFIPLIIVVYMATLSAIPLQPRTLGWYSNDQGIHVQVLMPFCEPPLVTFNPRPPACIVQTQSASRFNRSRSFDVAFHLAVTPILFVGMLCVSPITPWQAFRGVFKMAM
jgi:hypothetical protein